MRRIKTLLIGVGYHARRIYVPYLRESDLCELVACLDLFKYRERVKKTIRDNFKDKVRCYFTPKEDICDNLSSDEKELLKKIIRTHKIEAVIISTEPLAHFKYTYWAVKNNINVLLDKPLTTEIGVSTRKDKSLKLFEDYQRILKVYEKNCKKKNLIFNLQAQRRYHVGFLEVRRKIKEMKELTNCPVTFIQTFHSDGQWTFPHEFATQTYHPYNQGYGKMSHSGYHSLDIALWFAITSLPKEKRWDNYTLYSQFIRPSDVVSQFNKKDYLKIFPEMKKSSWDFKINEISDCMGEVDSSTGISLKKGKDIITFISNNSLHHSFSRRGWYDSKGKDLYKGNGRVRQESYIIEQGPFQSIIINSFQSEEIRRNNISPYKTGGEYHFEIHVFRNDNILKDCKAYENINIKDLKEIKDLGYSRGHQEDARRSCLQDFFLSIIKNKKPSDSCSNLMYHSLSIQVLSSIYNSSSMAYHNENPIINQKIFNKNKIYGN